MDSTILGLIPARAGSRGVPGKHTKPLGGKPLIHHTFQSATQATFLNTIALSTDSHEVIETAKSFPNIEVPFVRPAHLAKDETPTILVVQHALTFYQSIGRNFDFVCLLQPTTPFRQDGFIDKAISYFLSANTDSLTTVRTIPSKYNPHWCFKIGDDERLKPVIEGLPMISRRQDLPAAYYRDGQIYIVSTQLALEGFLLTERTIGLINDDGPDINIDSMDDWGSAEKWLSDGK